MGDERCSGGASDGVFRSAASPQVGKVEIMKPVSMIAVVVFGIVAMLQLMRFAMGWDVSVNGEMIPLWASLIACAVAGSLAFGLWREGHEQHW